MRIGAFLNQKRLLSSRIAAFKFQHFKYFIEYVILLKYFAKVQYFSYF